jgi:hypothetical protein
VDPSERNIASNFEWNQFEHTSAMTGGENLIQHSLVLIKVVTKK